MNTGVGGAGWTLTELAQDQDLVGDAPPPRFAWSLLKLEQQYLDALGGKGTVELPAARDALNQALVAQLEMDRESLAQLAPGDDAYEATRTRCLVIEARLQAMAGADDPESRPAVSDRPRRARARTGPHRTAGWAMQPVSLLAGAVVVAVLVIAVIWIASSDHKSAGQVGSRTASATSAASQPPVTTNTAAAGTNTNTTPANTNTTPANTDTTPTEVSQILPAVVAAVNAASAHRALPSALDPPASQLGQDVDRLRRSCVAWGHATSASICRLGDTTTPRTLVLLGDSHALMWLPTVRALAQTEHWQLVPLLKLGCHAGGWASARGRGSCYRWFHWALSQDRSLRPAVTLVAGAYSYESTGNEQPLASGLEAAVTGVESRSSRVVVIGDTPWLTKQPVDCLRAPKPSMASCSEPLTLAEAELTSFAAHVVAASHAAFIDTTGWFCYKAQCPLVVGKDITFRDTNHVSSVYALALSPAFRSAFDRALKLG